MAKEFEKTWYQTPLLELIMEADTQKKWAETMSRRKKAKGFGDSVASITSLFGVKPCGGCKKRQEKLNKMFPYKK